MVIAPEIQALFVLVLNATLTVAVPLLTVKLITWVSTKAKLAKTELSNDQRYMLESVVQMFMRAAEQSGTIGLIENTGKAEKAYVIEKTQGWLDAHGLSGISTQHIGDLIESLIFEGVHKADPPRPSLTDLLGG